MTKERDINNKVVKEVNGYVIVRSEARDYDKFTGTYSGHKKVYYDVCDDEWMLDSFKTLKEAVKFAEQLTF